jgi:hypothetical protein
MFDDFDKDKIQGQNDDINSEMNTDEGLQGNDYDPDNLFAALSQNTVMSNGMLQPIPFTQMALASALPPKTYKVKEGKLR